MIPKFKGILKDIQKDFFKHVYQQFWILQGKGLSFALCKMRVLLFSPKVMSDSCNPVDCSLPGSSFHGISQARILEWVAISFSRGSSWPRDQTLTPCSTGGFFTTAPPGKPNMGIAAAAAAGSLQSCPTLCDPIDCSPPGSAVPRILQARTLEWVAISFSNAWKWKVKVKSLSRAELLATPWTAAYQAPPSMGFSRQEYWSGLPSPSPNMRIRSVIFKPYHHLGFQDLSK